MWFLLFSLLLQSVTYSEAKFGTPYLQNSRLCQPWSCVNTRLGLPMSLPPREEYTTVLKSLLPEEWHQAIGKALDVCYGDRPRVYINTCPGQALLHCTVDNIIENCPDEYWRKDDACYPVSSLAGWNYMFSQSRYQNLEKNLPKESRPAWFMKQYFSSKCCNIPNFLNRTMLSACGFHTFMKYYDHDPKTNNPQQNYMVTRKSKLNNEDKTAQLPEVILKEDSDDPLDCCDMKDFIAPSWRSECDFKLTWNGVNRLNIDQNLAQTTTLPPVSTTAPVNRDVKVVPLTCEKETCIFKKLNVISELGVVDIEAFSKFLDNFTTAHQSWTKAKARVITQCLSKNSEGYEADCEINKLLSCTFDVLTENCPSKMKFDVCSSRNLKRNHTICQISSSKYRPKNRRSICGLPSFVDNDLLTECGATGINKIEFVPEAPVKLNRRSKKVEFGWHSTYTCQDSTPSTLCIMRKMGVLNKYSFLDYFKMRDHIRDFTSRHPEWSPLSQIYLNTFSNMPLYREHCSSPKKILNVVDAMLMTCPTSKRKNTSKCNNFFNDILNTPPTDYRNITGKQLDEILQHFNHVFLPSATVAKPSKKPKKYSREISYTVKKPIYDYGVFSSKNIPPVKIVDVETTPKGPLVIIPVYMRNRGTSDSRKKPGSLS